METETAFEELASRLCDRVTKLQDSIEKAINWLDMNAPGRAREELLEALGVNYPPATEKLLVANLNAIEKALNK